MTAAAAADDAAAVTAAAAAAAATRLAWLGLAWFTQQYLLSSLHRHYYLPVVCLVEWLTRELRVCTAHSDVGRLVRAYKKFCYCLRLSAVGCNTNLLISTYMFDGVPA